MDVLDVFGFLLAAVECWLQTHPSQFLNSWFDLRDATPIDHFLMGEALKNQNLLQTLNSAEEAASNPSLGNGQIVLAEAVEEDYTRRNFGWRSTTFLLVV